MLDPVIRDSGPLITLGSVDRLDLIDRFRSGILIADMVGYDIERGPDTAPDKAAFSKWFKGRGNRVQTVDTLRQHVVEAVRRRPEIDQRQNPHVPWNSPKDRCSRLACGYGWSGSRRPSRRPPRTSGFPEYRVEAATIHSK
jgi:hypothetical protein